MARTEVIGRDDIENATRSAFKSLFARPSFQMIELSSAIADASGDLRHLVRAETGQTLKSPDSTFIATAITLEVDELHSFDPHMLRLDRRECVHGLRIRKPSGSQTSLAI